jgi:hypothetical protein
VRELRSKEEQEKRGEDPIQLWIYLGKDEGDA